MSIAARGLTLEDIDLLEQRAIEQARNSFWAYRQYMDPKLKKGWWQRELAKKLQNFGEDFVAGKRPKLFIEAPPQHGKSIQVVDLVCWLSGHHPDLRTIYTSYSDRLGVRANLRFQRSLANPKYAKVFPFTKMNETGNVSMAGQKLRNKEIVEFVNGEGYFRNTTVLGSITGESLDLGIIDDPIKGREAAGSETIRNKTWEWFLDDFFTRFSEEAALLGIMTRWHVDDLVGRMKDLFPDMIILKYPALAVEDEENRKEGEPLFPEHKSLGFLLERKNAMFSANWEALYQQNPIITGGHIIKGVWFHRHTLIPRILYRKIFADTAMKTEERHDYSVLECWGKGEDGRIYLLDLQRGKWEAPDLERKVIDFWNKHKALKQTTYGASLGALRQMIIEDKASGTGLIQKIKKDGKIPIRAQERTKDKYTRVLDVLNYIESGLVSLPDSEDAPWVSDFISECEMFTADDSHLNDDQIDPMLDAINDILVETGGRFF